MIKLNKKTSAFFKDTTHLMVYGHESWLELAGSHGHVGENVTVYLKWGHNMQVDGLAGKEEMKALQWQEMTGRDGRLALQARESGRYLLIARCRVLEGEEGGYDELSLTTTYAFMVTK
ncbi:hypothetical protein IT084_05580 [Desulfallas sp. Bu1-1]|uniref:hypothetical protein n=1 Tax=Desulfallas sp. Bu1-1 TaxID=2787620 RepID=UPI00189D1140|nr:hypothetical protein [Desulfallas sp. Bu1-1]MBF7082449.1 hypothetical protein [Desulfallas sp. Bu1-1]